MGNFGEHATRLCTRRNSIDIFNPSKVKTLVLVAMTAADKPGVPSRRSQPQSEAWQIDIPDDVVAIGDRQVSARQIAVEIGLFAVQNRIWDQQAFSGSQTAPHPQSIRN